MSVRIPELLLNEPETAQEKANRYGYGQEVRNYSLKLNLTFKCFALEKFGFDNEYGPHGPSD